MCESDTTRLLKVLEFSLYFSFEDNVKVTTETNQPLLFYDQT